MGTVALRDVQDADLDLLFEYMRDPEAVRMAAFVGRDPNDRAAFDAHRARISADPTILDLAITLDGAFVGTIASFVIEGDTELSYWIDPAHWGQGIATQALTLFLDRQPHRPLHARAATDNQASLRVLQKSGFHITGTDRGFAQPRNTEIEETILQLDQKS
ncbi:GNAT family N-acetyltransferase [Kribbella sandramycini]|uniref:GNAT family N-acetyltransferase n=1 Tax=Kribbella sandramycini TaxID=60450 RepID=A0A7Y4NXR4_9ACTN|nr:GNAT family N-acetyltransferase [Kribbella sandramycini]MBB6570019.1 RimJ/RimL family protein N-acetyltransferase [Kribbella sandramycini]NOL40157.1 GNAT family N-acetyltransferase [Kribbella sandramycini]